MKNPISDIFYKTVGSTANNNRDEDPKKGYY